jgi:hypothetical protein
MPTWSAYGFDRVVELAEPFDVVPQGAAADLEARRELAAAPHRTGLH